MEPVTGDEARVRGTLERVMYIARDPNKSAWLAGLLSFVIPGLGQLYVGQHVKGVALFVVSALLCFGFGLANVLVGLDAMWMGWRVRSRDVGRFEVSIWLVMVRWLMSWIQSLIPDSYQAGRPLRIDGEIRLPRVEATGAWVEEGRAEYASVATFARVALELMALGAPASLVRRAHEAALDEIRHAETCFARSGREVRPGPLEGADAPIRATLVGVALTSLTDGCLGEGFAAVMLDARAAGDPVLAQMAEDERRHAELAWAVLAWAVEVGGPRVEAAVLGQLPLLPRRTDERWEAVRRDVVARAGELVRSA